jgi:hypothetical protein
MKFILTKIPVVEDVLVAAFRSYLKELRYGELFPNHKNINVSNDHPFERLLDNEGSTPDIFPSITIVSSSDAESGGMAKGWKVTTLEDGDIDSFDGLGWYVSDTAKTDLTAALAEKGSVHGLMHNTVWRDSTSFEIWTENLQVKNDLYNLVMAFLTGPKMLELHNASDLTITSNSIQGQRSGYYNYDFGRVLYGGRISLSVDYPVMQAVYDTSVSSLAEIEHSYREVIHG